MFDGTLVSNKEETGQKTQRGKYNIVTNDKAKIFRKKMKKKTYPQPTIGHREPWGAVNVYKT